jgi:hypothetical protein
MLQYWQSIQGKNNFILGAIVGSVNMYTTSLEKRATPGHARALRSSRAHLIEVGTASWTLAAEENTIHVPNRA